MSALETAKFRQLNQLIKTTMHLHRAFLCPYKRHFHSKAAILPERSTMNLEFRADGVTLIGVLIANGKAQAVTDTKLGQLALSRCLPHPGRYGQRPGLHRPAPGVQAAGGR